MMPLRKRLSLGLLPILLLFLLVCLYAYRSSQELGESVEAILSRNFHAVRVVQELRGAVAQMNAAVSDGRQGDPAAALPRFVAARTRFKRGLNDELLAQPGHEKAERLNAVDAEFQRFTAVGDETLRLGVIDSLDLLKRSEAGFFAVNQALDALLEQDHREIIDAEARVNSRIENALHVFVVAMFVAVALFFFLAWRMASSFLQPIQVLTESAVALGNGDLERKVPVSTHLELGQLARAFNTMAEHLRAYRDATVAKVMRTQRTMEATLTSTPEPVFVVSKDGRVEVRNPAAEELAKSPDFATGFPPGLAGPLADVLHSGTHYLPTDYAKIVTLKPGREERHYLPRILAIGDTLTDFKGAAVILQDVTKFRLLDDAKTNLVGTVSHELKSPLTSLRMAVYLLLEQNIPGLSPTQQELLETVRDESDRLLRILDNLLDLARLEAGASSLERQPMKVSDLLEQMAAEARGFIEPEGQSLVVEVGPDAAGTTIKVDRSRIRHVFINLLANASKYSPRDGVIALSAALAPEGFVRFAVTDHGPGIPPEIMAQVFDRFYRAPGQAKTGAGLGLAIAREIVVAHGGSIACTSEVGRETTFYFLLPM